MELVLGALIFVLIQVPFVRKLGFSFKPSLSLESIKSSGVLDVFKLIWPRTLSIANFSAWNNYYGNTSFFFTKSGKKLCNF